MHETSRLFDQRPLVERYLRKTRPQLSSLSFINLCAWQDFFRFELSVIGDCLCVFAENPVGTFLYLPPLGDKVTPAVIDACFERMEQANRGSGVTRIENVSLAGLADFPQNRYTRYLKGYEYCYFRKSLGALRGALYRTKRGSYNQFVKGYAYAYRPYEESMAEECLALYREWARSRRAGCSDEVYCSMLDENEQVHRTVLHNFRTLGLIGRVVFVEGRLCAYTFGYPLTAGMFCILFEIADLTLRGLATFIFIEFCRDRALEPYAFINVMDDSGIANIRRTKDSFRPEVLIPVYGITQNGVMTDGNKR